MTPCQFSSLTKGSLCSSCGYQLKKDHRVAPTCDGALLGIDVLAAAESSLGVVVSEFLTSYGITQEWYVDFKRKFGLPPVCDCSARKEWLDKTAEAHPTIASIGVKLLDALKRKT